ncbi:LacI family DNA-binding transcriptional regulator [Celerinatantimonas yamalensis]|uniref:LacI family DNA-binding transcriptional regulator n=1 Tax=Celerinatantimonas yamalensis TaxID=559956 RepID=A0ABW9G533_9GAMM
MEENSKKKINRKKQVTLADIAKVVGVGNMTVSRALRTPEKVSDAVRQKVEKVALEMGYLTPIQAKLTQNTGLILVHSSDYLAYFELFSALQDMLHKANINFLIDSSIRNSDDETNKLKLLTYIKPSFVILSATPHSGETTYLLSDLNIPVIEILSEIPTPIDINIGISQQKSMHDLTTKHIDHGYSDICFVCDNSDIWKIKQQIIGWQRAMISRGLNPEKTLNIPQSFHFSKSSSVVPDILFQWPTTQLILCSSTQIANAIICECLRRKIKIPEVLSIASIGSLDVAQSLYPSLSNVDIPFAELAKDIYNVIKQCLNGAPIEHKKMIREAHIQLRESSSRRKPKPYTKNDWF